MDEYTLIKTAAFPLPHGEVGLWYPDLNVVVLSPELDTEARRHLALWEVQAHWRQECIRFVPEPRAASAPQQAPDLTA